MKRVLEKQRDWERREGKWLIDRRAKGREREEREKRERERERERVLKI